jgi:hypothetical protein
VLAGAYLASGSAACFDLALGGERRLVLDRHQTFSQQSLRCAKEALGTCCARSDYSTAKHMLYTVHM